MTGGAKRGLQLFQLGDHQLVACGFTTTSCPNAVGSNYIAPNQKIYGCGKVRDVGENAGKLPFIPEQTLTGVSASTTTRLSWNRSAPPVRSPTPRRRSRCAPPISASRRACWRGRRARRSWRRPRGGERTWSSSAPTATGQPRGTCSDRYPTRLCCTRRARSRSSATANRIHRRRPELPPVPDARGKMPDGGLR